jgi:hypothetical protein
MFLNSLGAYNDGMKLAKKMKDFQDRKKAAEQRLSSSASSTTVTDDETSTSTSTSTSILSSSSLTIPRRSFFGRTKGKAPKEKPDVIKSSDAPERAVSRNKAVSKVAVPLPQDKTLVATAAAASASNKTTQVKKKLRLIADMIASQEEREGQIDQEIVKLLHEAKIKNASGNQRAAIRLLKKRKMKQREQDKISRAIETMEAQVWTIESALENAKVVRVMQEGADAVKTLRDDKTYGLTIDAVEDALADIRDTVEYTEEIQQILAEPIGTIDVDDDELLKELQDMEDTFLGCPEVSAPSDGMPDVPTTKLRKGDEVMPGVPTTKLDGCYEVAL